MNHDKLIGIVDAAGVPYDKPVTRQEQYNMVRFFHDATNRSLNLGFRSPDGPFVADFFFKGKSQQDNAADRDAFLHLFGGVPGSRSTAFARVEPQFSEEVWLVMAIQGYWAMGQRHGA